MQNINQELLQIVERIEMRWIIKPFMKTAAYSNLPALYEEKDRIEAEIARAKKSKAKVAHLYEMAWKNNVQCLKWERWLT